ncbi:Signal transduction histidine kinase CheA [Minicystis rosea]|nr:Signal transduction histidine kinase CheA [Minicystis rosea]
MLRAATRSSTAAVPRSRGRSDGHAPRARSTRRRHSLRSLVAYQARLRLFVESNLLGIATGRIDGIIEESNDAFLSMTGYTREDVRAGMVSWRSMTPPEWRHVDVEALERLRATGSTGHFEKEYVRKDGSRVAVLLGSTFADIESERIIFFALDISAQKKAEAELARMNAVLEDQVAERTAELYNHQVRLELALAAAKCGWFDWNVQKGTDVWSKETEALYGMPPGGFAGTYEAWRRCIHPDDLVELEQRIGHALATGSFHHTYRVVWPDGTIRWLLARARVFKNDEGRPLRMVGAEVDVTDLAEARQRVERLATERGQLLGEATRALRARDAFVTVASHELKTPLTPLRLSLQSLRAEVERSTSFGHWIPRIDLLLRQVDRLAGLVDALLEVARGASARKERRFVPTDLAALAREAIARTTPAAIQARCAITLHTAGDTVAAVDPLRIEQVFTHLLANAVRFGAGKPIMVSVDASPGSVRLVVEDHGIGIAPEDQSRIFGLFERASDERLYGGLGLGLYVARSIIEAHDGTIICKSAPGSGARFEIELPKEHPVKPLLPRSG